MHVALAGPHVQVLAAGDPAHVGAEELVRAEQHLAVLGDRGDHLDRVRRRAADVGLRLHRRGGVDVGDDDRAGMLGLPRAQFVGGDRVGQRAARPLIGDQHGLVRAEDLGRLGHEVHAAEHDGVLGRLGGDPRQRQRVTDVVGDVLDGRQLVVVRQQRRAAQLGEAAHLGGPLLIAVDAGKTGRTGDDSVRQIVSGHAVENRHRRLLTPVRGFRLIIENMPHISTAHEVLAVVFQVRGVNIPKPALHVLLWQRALEPAARKVVASGRPAPRRRGHDQLGSPSTRREGRPA